VSDGRAGRTEYLAPYSSGPGLSLMPPSTAASMPALPASSTASTRYSVTIARHKNALPAWALSASGSAIR
jgi:hypothetical protein